MITLEKVDKLREYANVGYEDAKFALEAAEGDLLEAVIYLEKQGKIKRPENNGTFISENLQQKKNEQYSGQYRETREEDYTVKNQFERFWEWCCKIIHKGNTNYFVFGRKSGTETMIPVTIMVIGICFFFWIIVPLLVIGLFFGFRYKFSGPDLGKDNINEMMDSVSDTADNIKRTVVEEYKKTDTNQHDREQI